MSLLVTWPRKLMMRNSGPSFPCTLLYCASFLHSSYTVNAVLETHTLTLTNSEARVMWDLVTLKSKGYGFVAFGSKKEAEQAMEDMTGHQIGSRSIRLNWATQKNHRRILPYQFPPALQHLSSECSSQSLPSSSASLLHVSASALSLSDSPKRMPYLCISYHASTHSRFIGEYAQSRPDSPAKYEDILGQSSPYNTTVYIGNLALDTQREKLLVL